MLETCSICGSSPPAVAGATWSNCDICSARLCSYCDCEDDVTHRIHHELIAMRKAIQRIANVVDAAKATDGPSVFAGFVTLASCKHCGGDAKHRQEEHPGGTMHWVQCLRCGIRTPLNRERDVVTSAWNRSA